MAKKSGQNQGSVSVRKDGLIQAQISVDGKRITRYFKSKKEANAWKIESLNKIQKGMFNTNTQISLGEFLDRWLADSNRSVKIKTHLQHKQIINQHIKPYLGEIKLIELRPNMVQQLYSKKEEMGLGQRTILLIHCVLHCALNQAVKEDLIFRNPLDAVIRPRFVKKEMKFLNEIQVRSFLIACKGHRLEMLFKLAITTGLREGEILGLKWSDLNWETHQLSVQRQLQRIPQVGLLMAEPKSASGKRMIMLGPDTIHALRSHSNNQYIEQQFAGDRWQNNDLIFPSKLGTPNDPGNLIKEFKKFLRVANLPDMRFHDLRHTAASLMLRQGVPAKVVQERLGHSDISLTLNTYSHISPGMQEFAAQKMDEITALIDVGLPVEKN